MKVQEALTKGIGMLRAAGVPNAVQDARRLMSKVLDADAAGLAPRLHDEILPLNKAEFDGLIKRRAAREPITQIIGAAEFFGRSYRVTADTLSPRPETERLVELCLEADPSAQFLDLGTGTGCIAVSILCERPLSRATAVDKSGAALKVAHDNAIRHGVDGRLDLVIGDWLENVTGTFGVMFSNPPYIAQLEMAGLEPEVREHEPMIALVAGDDGLDAYRRILSRASTHLNPGGRLLFECASSQVGVLAQMVSSAGFSDVAIINDLGGQPRVVSGWA